MDIKNAYICKEHSTYYNPDYGCPGCNYRIKNSVYYGLIAGLLITTTIILILK